MLKAYQTAFADVRAALRLRRVWIALAHEDVGDQHRRTTLGPLWLVLNYFAFIIIFLFVFQRHGDHPHFASYMAVGLLVWFLIQENLSNGVSLFVREESFIKGTRLPLTIYILRQVMQTVIRMAYAAVGGAIILAIDGLPLTWNALWAIPGLMIVLVALPAAVTIFAFLGAYLPDSQYIVSNLMRIGMFVTPVFWLPGVRGGVRGLLYAYNPATYFLEIVRFPLVDGVFPLHAFIVTGICCVVLWSVALMLLGRLKRDLVFVL